MDLSEKSDGNIIFFWITGIGYNFIEGTVHYRDGLRILSSSFETRNEYLYDKNKINVHEYTEEL